MTAYRRSEGTAPSILNLIIRWRWIAIFTPRPPYHQGKDPGIHWIRDLLGPRVSLDILEKGILALQVFEPRIIRPAHMTHNEIGIKEVLFSGMWRREVWYKYNELRRNVGLHPQGVRVNHDGRITVNYGCRCKEMAPQVIHCLRVVTRRGRGKGGGPSPSGIWEEEDVEGEKREHRRKIWNCVTHQYCISRRNCSNFSM